MLSEINILQTWACAMQGWSPKIGDPTLAGWVTVASYLGCAGLSLLVVSRMVRRAGREAAFWLVISVLLLFLSVNKQLDLQSLLTALGRCVALSQEWYGERREFQQRFILGILGVMAAAFVLGLIVMRNALRRNGLALIGLAFIVTFVAVRATGFHHFDTFINRQFMEVRYNVLLELSGLVLIGVNALLIVRRGPRRAGR